MITPEDIVKVELFRDDIALAQKYAKDACIGGSSSVRKVKEDRLKKLRVDQMVGQLGTLAGQKWLRGHLDDYIKGREIANANPTKGDDGYDDTEYPIDFKASLMRRSLDPLTYTLAVRPREKHDNHIYILILIEKHMTGHSTAHIVGSATTNDLPAEKADSGTFRGAYIIPASKLKPLPRGNMPAEMRATFMTERIEQVNGSLGF